jgi:Mce-associated membrane protein
VEGQQPEAGDLSDSAPEESPQSVAEVEESQADDSPADETPKEPSAARKWLAHNRKKLAVVSSVGLFVAAGAFAGAAVQPYLMDRATVATKEKVARTAADAITTLWSYSPDDMDKLSERSAKFLGGDFAVQYRRYVDAIAPTNKQAKVTSSTQVVAAAVESLRGSEATALVYTNTTSATPKSNNIPSLKYLSYRLELQREGRDWRVTKMTTVTSLDLTPKL